MTAGPYPYPFSGGYEKCPSLDLDPMYAQLRETEPVAQVRTPEGEVVTLVTRHAEVRKVLGQPKLFSREHAAVADALRPEAFLVDIEGDRHRAQRDLVKDYFTAAEAEKLRPRAQQITDGLLDAMQASSQPADLIELLALPLPITIICEVLGIPAADRTQFGAWAEALVGLRPGAGEAEMVATAEAGTALADYMAKALAERAARPGSDLLTVLAQADAPQVDAKDRILLAIAVLVAGFETTASMLGNMVLLLIGRHRPAWRQLQQQPAWIPTAVDELLRLIPVDARDGMPRGTTRDTRLGDVLIPQDTAVLVARAAANRDPRCFDNPDELDLRRAPNPHLTFGHGPHLCLGAHLARMELQVALRTLIARFPDLRLAIPEPDLQWKHSTMRGLKALPVRWTRP
ncbi:cytochrome P450 [Actinomadura fulvescens]|uniref:Cytochrome P450 n=2 Tax=Actinomadura fulvescens TaxID=46160 RepID=A0ABP6DBV1_9ACTN